MINMETIPKVFVVIMLSLATVVVCDDFSNSVLNCLKDVDVTKDELNTFFHGGMKPADAKDNIKCFIKCYMEKEGYMRDGMLVEDATIKAFREAPEMKNVPNVEQIFYDCKKELGANDCDTAFKIRICWDNHKLNLRQ